MQLFGDHAVRPKTCLPVLLPVAGVELGLLGMMVGGGRPAGRALLPGTLISHAEPKMFDRLWRSMKKVSCS